MESTKAGTMCGNDDLWCKSRQHFTGLINQRLKGSTAEVETTQNRIDLRNPCQHLCITDDVDNPCVPTSCEHDESFLLDVEHQCLIIKHEGIRHPFATTECLLAEHSMFK